MNTKLLMGSALTGLVLAGGIAGFASAQTAAETTGLTEEQVIAIALEAVPGEVTEVERDDHRGAQIFEVEVMGADGVEKEIKIAAETGEVLKIETEDGDCDKEKHKDKEGDDDAA